MLDGRVKHARLGVPLLVFATAMAFGGCDDNNLFQPPTGAPPEILALSAPAQVQAGQKLDVAVRAKGALPLDSVVVKVRGAFSGDESVIFETVTYDQSIVVGFNVPIAIVDTIATVTAYAYDVNGQVSTAVQDQVRIIDRTPPTVSVSSKEDNVGQGGTLEIGLQASDNVGLAQAGYRLLQESGDTLAVVLATVSGTKVDTTFLYPISDDLAEGALLIEGIAVDVDGNTGTDQESTALQVIDVIPPVVAVGVPQEGASFATSLPLPVSLDFYDNSGVTKLRIEGYALRDNPFTGIPDRIARYEMLEVDFGEAIPDSSFSALLVAIPDNTGEDAFLVVTATDARGNAGADTVTIALEPALATAGIVVPAEGATQAVGQPLLASTQMSDNVGIAQVRFSVFAQRGNPDLGTGQEVARYEPVTVDFTFPALPADTVISRLLQPLNDSTSEAAFVRVEVTDAEGNLTVTEQAISIVADETPPAVVLGSLQSPAPIGAPLSVTATSSDQAGVAAITYEAFALRGDPDLGTQVRVDIYDPVTVSFVDPETGLGVAPSDTTLTRVLEPNAGAMAEMLYVVASSSDRSGNVGADTMTIMMEAQPPAVTILDPPDLLGYPVGDSILVQARITDNTGISQVVLSGFALRGNPNLGTEQTVARFQPKSVMLPVAPGDTIISRWLLPTPDSASEDAFVVVQAVDDQGNMGADTITLRLGTPKVEILAPTGGSVVQNDRSLGIRIRVTDPRGVQYARILVSGAVSDTIDYFPQQGSAVLVTEIVEDTAVALLPTASGELEITVTARNTLGIEGTPRVVVLAVSEEGDVDVIPPDVGMEVVNRGRVELTDSIFVQLSGSDDPEGTGVVSVGYSVRGISPSRGDTIVLADTVIYDPPRTATVLREFGFRPFGADPAALPDTLVYEITGYMIDEAGNCAATTMGGSAMESLDCGTFDGLDAGGNPATIVVAEDLPGAQELATVVGGRTVLLPAGGRIMDTAVDTAGRKLFLSNLDRNQVEVFRLQTETFGSAVGVGSQPWGMTMNRGGDTLIVANSGGTNFSLVDVAAEREIDADRFLTPDVVLFDVNVSDGDTGLSYEIKEYPVSAAIRFSDRPQFVAVDSFGNLLYTTRTTEIGDLGTARKAYFEPGMLRPEVKVMVEHTQFTLVEDAWALANIDNVRLDITTDTDTAGVTTSTTEVVLLDHIPGFPDSVVSGSGNGQSFDAIVQAAGELSILGSDVFVRSSTNWNTSFTFSDTTFVAASGDGGWVLVGEGATEPVGKLLMYQAAPRDTLPISTVREVWNDFTNRSDLVRGIGLNYDGTLGVARGGEVGFFDSQLTLQGIPSIYGDGGGTGAALHPLHANQKTTPNFAAGEYRPDTHLAVVGGGNNTIEVIDTWRFLRVGQVAIRDQVSGPLRAILPFPEDNVGLTCSTVPVTDKRGIYIGDAVQLYTGGNFNAPIAPNGITDDRCIVIKLFAITSAGGVSVIDVRKSDVLRFHPNRPN